MLPHLPYSGNICTASHMSARKEDPLARIIEDFLYNIPQKKKKKDSAGAYVGNTYHFLKNILEAVKKCKKPVKKVGVTEFIFIYFFLMPWG